MTTAYFENIYDNKAVYYPSPSHVNWVFVYQNTQYKYKRLFKYKYFFINVDTRTRVVNIVEVSLTDISHGYVIFFSIKNKLVLKDVCLINIKILVFLRGLAEDLTFGKIKGM